jgi:hypothetical protein
MTQLRIKFEVINASLAQLPACRLGRVEQLIRNEQVVG